MPRATRYGTKCGIYLEQPGATTQVRTWCPTLGAQFGLLVTHNEAISIADYYTVKGKDGKAEFRPTAHYAYHPCNSAVVSLDEMFGNAGKKQKKTHVLHPEEILDGADELGVLLYGHKKNAYWFGSTLTCRRSDQTGTAAKRHRPAGDISRSGRHGLGAGKSEVRHRRIRRNGFPPLP